MILWIGIDPTADDYLGLGVEVKIYFKYKKIIKPRKIIVGRKVIKL